MSHTCHAIGCNIQVPPKMFMCKSHWFALPKSMRDEIWKHYMPGQENSKTPTSEYINIATKCIDYIREKYPPKPTQQVSS